jgi:hypothetical protein
MLGLTYNSTAFGKGKLAVLQNRRLPKREDLFECRWGQPRGQPFIFLRNNSEVSP